MSYFCTTMVSATRPRSTRSSDDARFATPLAALSDGLSGKDFEDRQADDLLPRRHRRSEVGVADGDDHQLRIKNEKAAGGCFEQGAEVRLRRPSVVVIGINRCALTVAPGQLCHPRDLTDRSPASPSRRVVRTATVGRS